MADQGDAEPNSIVAPVPAPAPADPWAAELARLHQVELRQAAQLVAAGQAVAAQMDRLLDELRHLRRQVEALRLVSPVRGRVEPRRSIGVRTRAGARRG